MFGLVNCVDGFSEQPQVINGFSDTMAEVRGSAKIGVMNDCLSSFIYLLLCEILLIDAFVLHSGIRPLLASLRFSERRASMPAPPLAQTRCPSTLLWKSRLSGKSKIDLVFLIKIKFKNTDEAKKGSACFL